jgi:hypothetical protein
MAKQTINIGASPNDGTGTPLRTAFDYTNQNFTELYTATGPSGNNIVVPGSATITGDLTVRTTGLVVNSTGTGVQVSPSAPLCVKTRNSDSVGLRVLQSTGGTAGIQFTDDPVTADWGSILATSANLFLRSNSLLQLQTGGATERFAISSTGICTWSNVGGVAGTAMTLNSTGLGVGGSPAAKLHIVGGVSATVEIARFAASSGPYVGIGTEGTNYTWIQSFGGKPLQINPQGNDTILNPSSGNVGVGVTPSAWNSSYKALQIGTVGGLSSVTNSMLVSANYYRSASADVYIANGFATLYQQTAGAHQWYNAPSGTAGNNITFTQAMTLDASGRLLVGKPSGVNNIETVGAGVDGRGSVTGVSTVATTIYTIKQSSTAAMCVVFGDDGSNGFCDIVLFLATVAPKVVSSQTLYGSPAARTYTASTTNLQLAVASGTLTIRTAALSTLNS